MDKILGHTVQCWAWKVYEDFMPLTDSIEILSLETLFWLTGNIDAKYNAKNSTFLKYVIVIFFNIN